MARAAFARFAAALSIFAAPAVLAQSAPAQPDPATMTLLQCMKMPAASPQQARCMAEVKHLHAAMQAQAAQAAQQSRMQRPKANLATAPNAAPSAPPSPPPPVPAEVKAAAQATGLAGMQPAPATSLAVPTATLAVKDLSGKDLETAMMMVQSQRANILEAQLADQIKAVEARNEQIARLNAAIAKMNRYMAAFPPSAISSATLADTGAVHLGPKSEYSGTIPGCRLEQEINTLLSQTGMKPFTQQGGGPYNAKGRMLDPNGALTYGDPRYYYAGGLGGDTTKGQLDAAIQALKGQIDSLNNTQQMDMLKLQALANKRNEAIDMMTSFIKKMADSRSSVLGNMR